jgi:predicted secreted protein
MGVGSLIAIYLVVWWVVLFAVLPWGVRTQQAEGDVVLGTAHSAPMRPMLVRKAIVTSIVAGAIVFLIWLAVDVYGYGIETLANLFDLRQ